MYIEIDSLKKWMNFKNKMGWLILVGLFLFLMCEFYMPVIIKISTKLIIDNSLEKFVNEQIKDLNTSEEKIINLLEWEKTNFKGIYDTKQFMFWFTKNGHTRFCIRTDKDNDREWVYFSKCGACGESALLFKAMMDDLNISTRLIKNPGDDHTWTEVNLNGSWIITDPSQGKFNLTIQDMNWGFNRSYVYADYSNGTKIDLTNKYNPTGNLTIKYKGNKSVKVQIIKISPNFQKDTQIECNLSLGNCNLSLGDGIYKIIAITQGVNKKYSLNEINITVGEVTEIMVLPDKIYIAYLIFPLQIILLIVMIFFSWIMIGLLFSIRKGNPLKYSINPINSQTSSSNPQD
ncbi:MAG: transglutaminase domain-containing protein [Candidatus Pacearchaeota archaeon]